MRTGISQDLLRFFIVPHERHAGLASNHFRSFSVVLSAYGNECNSNRADDADTVAFIGCTASLCCVRIASKSDAK
jgi:hypothetical protein